LEILVSIVNKGDQSARQVRCPLQDRVAVGRGPECAVLIEGPAISREHLILEGGPDAVLITDVSANGCWINGSRIPKSRPLPVRDSDAVEVPGFELRIQQVAVAPPPLPEGGTREIEPVVATGTALHALGPMAALLGSFTRLEKTAAIFALLSLGLVLVYALS
jgi:predicted component of type VI protein secretion system